MNNQQLAELDDIASAIGKDLVRWGRMSVSQTKEKFGEVRVYVSIGWWQFHDILWPGYMYMRWPFRWMKWLDIYVGPKFINVLNHIVVPYHKWLYRKVYAKYVKKHPQYREAILVGADWPEFLEGL